MSSAAFSRAHNQWLQPPEESPAFIEWYDAQESKKDLIEMCRLQCDGGFPCADDIADIDSIGEMIELAKGSLQQLEEHYKELCELEDEFPVEYQDECPDDGE